MFKYLKRAFLIPWNLMVFGGTAIAAAMSPAPDAFLALVAAGELTFLFGLASIPRFRDAVDAEAYSGKTPGAAGGGKAESLDAILATLPADAQYRFRRLHTRCRQMRALADELQAGRVSTTTAGALRTNSLDQLLWGFLRLLRHSYALQRLMQSMNEDTLKAKLEEVKLSLSQAKASGDERLAKSYQEHLATAESRLEYYRRTNKDAEFVAAELDRIEDKIAALSEMAVNQRDPDSLSAEIDAAAASMQETEATITKLQDVTGVASDITSAPAILDTDLKAMARIR